jgi:hypothetical protein
MTIDIPEGYEPLGLAFAAAAAQAARGKGSERHSYDGERFADQLIFEIPRRLGACGSGFLLGQAAKKIYESVRLEPERARAEILGAMNYLAAAWNRQGGFSDAFGPAPEKPVPAPENVCLGFAERVVSLMKEAGVREVSFAHPGARICADGTVTGLHFTTEDFKFDEARMRESMPGIVPQEEDADMPCFQKGELVEYRLPDGTWVPAHFAFMDGGYCVLESGGERISVLRFNVREAETA